MRIGIYLINHTDERAALKTALEKDGDHSAVVLTDLVNLDNPFTIVADLLRAAKQHDIERVIADRDGGKYGELITLGLPVKTFVKKRLEKPKKTSRKTKDKPVESPLEPAGGLIPLKEEHDANI